MVTVTQEQLIQGLKTIKGATIVTLNCKTIPEMRKTDNPFWGNVFKFAVVNGLVNWIYENAVNRQRLRENLEPDFQAFPRKWGQRIRGTPFVIHKEELYLELKRQNVLEEEYRDREGNIISKVDLIGYFKAEGEGRQGVANKVILRDYKVDNIKSLVWRGEEYKVTDFELY